MQFQQGSRGQRRPVQIHTVASRNLIVNPRGGPQYILSGDDGELLDLAVSIIAKQPLVKVLEHEQFCQFARAVTGGNK